MVGSHRIFWILCFKKCPSCGSETNQPFWQKPLNTLTLSIWPDSNHLHDWNMLPCRSQCISYSQTKTVSKLFSFRKTNLIDKFVINISHLDCPCAYAYISNWVDDSLPHSCTVWSLSQLRKDSFQIGTASTVRCPFPLITSWVGESQLVK